MYLTSIYPPILNLDNLSIKNHGEAEANPIWFWVRGGVHPGQATNLLQWRATSHIYTYGQFRVANWPNLSFVCVRKLESPEEIHTFMCKACKLHTERLWLADRFVSRTFLHHWPSLYNITSRIWVIFEQNIYILPSMLPHTYLPHAHNGIGNKDQEYYKRLYESSDGALSFFKPGQGLTETKKSNHP